MENSNDVQNTTNKGNEVLADVSGGVKMTFGLTEKDLEVIKKYTSRWDAAEFDRDTWIRVGEEIGWESLSACLWYFRFHYR